MTKLIRILQLIVPLILVIAPFFYKRKFRWLVDFYLDMTVQPKVRKVYMLALSLVVILFSYSFFALEGANLWQTPTLLLGFVLLRYKFTEAMLHWIHEDKVIQGIVLGLVMFSMVVPELYSLSASMALVMTAAMFFPSRAIIEKAEISRFHVEYNMSDDEIVDLYF